MRIMPRLKESIPYFKGTWRLTIDYCQKSATELVEYIALSERLDILSKESKELIHIIILVSIGRLRFPALCATYSIIPGVFLMNL
jgi:hypothetical protein